MSTVTQSRKSPSGKAHPAANKPQIKVEIEEVIRPATKVFAFKDLIGSNDPSQDDPFGVIKMLRQGIQHGVIERLAEAGLSSKYRQQIIPERTFQRRQKAGERLTLEESERALRFARIVAEADRVFGEHEKGMRWLHSPMKQLENQSPLDVLDTDIGARLVEEILGQIDEGFFA